MIIFVRTLLATVLLIESILVISNSLFPAAQGARIAVLLVPTVMLILILAFPPAREKFPVVKRALFVSYLACASSYLGFLISACQASSIDTLFMTSFFALPLYGFIQITYFIVYFSTFTIMLFPVNIFLHFNHNLWIHAFWILTLTVILIAFGLGYLNATLHGIHYPINYCSF